MIGEFRRQQRRGGTGDDCFRAGKGVDQGEHFPLYVEVLGRILLDMHRIGQRLCQVRDNGDAGKDCVGRLSPQQIVGDEVGEDAGDVVAGAAGRGR